MKHLPFFISNDIILSGIHQFEFLDAPRYIHRIGALCLAVGTVRAFFKATPDWDLVERCPRLMEITVLCGVHVCPHEGGYVYPVRTTGQTFPALTAITHTEFDAVVGEKFALLGGELQVGSDREILLQMLKVVETGYAADSGPR